MNATVKAKRAAKDGNEKQKSVLVIEGMENGRRIDSRILEERLQKAVESGHRAIEVRAFGQHGIGGRLWKAGNEPLAIRVVGSPGQRVGSMGFPNTFIDIEGPASDDVGWLNGGARIVVHGHATNGCGNAMAQGTIYVKGDIGARGMTMTKHNPRFAPPELWVLGGVGDSFAEFMAGGVAVVCGHKPLHEDNVLGHRPCVGMVGGKIFFRGPFKGHSEEDARLDALSPNDWKWLKTGMKDFLRAVGRDELYETLTEDPAAWKVLVARKPGEKGVKAIRKMADFRRFVWDQELGKGGLIGDLTDLDRSPVPLIPGGVLRRYIPVWENLKFLPPCQAHCPTGIPVQKRWELTRKGLVDESVDLALAYTPFPVTVCGYLCPNVCMQNCTRQIAGMKPVDITVLGRASLKAKPPQPGPPTGRKVAIVGAGPAGLSIAWQLYLKGHEPVVYDRGKEPGGKITNSIPSLRIPDEIVRHEIDRIKGLIPTMRMRHDLTGNEFLRLRDESDFVVIATGAQKPRMLPIPGIERAVAALDFLRAGKENRAQVGKRVVVIGAGNVGCDAAAESARLGATDITLIDIQEPASFGKERKHAEAVGAKFLWPVSARAITAEGVELSRGDILPADTVIVAVGDAPDLGFLPKTIATEKGFIVVNDRFQTSDPKVFAVGDAVKPGLLTDAIGAGRKAAEAIDALFAGRDVSFDTLPPIPEARVKLEYYDPRVKGFGDVENCAGECASCGSCRDCSVCVTLCPQNAISRNERSDGAYEYTVDPERCIGCGFCAGACPCGIWQLVENVPLESASGPK